MKICQQCNISMKLIKNTNVLKEHCIIHKGDGFGISDLESNLHSDVYVCPQCGIVQQFVPEDELVYIKEL